MNEIVINVPNIPHGHGLSFKKGIADGLLDNREHENSCHETHSATYNSGHAVGEKLKTEIAKYVKA